MQHLNILNFTCFKIIFILLNSNYIKNTFLLTGITALENGTYNRSEELQKIFNKYKNDSEFTVYLELYITNDEKSKEIEEYIKKFNKKNPKYIAKIYYLNEFVKRRAVLSIRE